MYRDNIELTHDTFPESIELLKETSPPTPEIAVFYYQVRVQEQSTGEFIEGAKVMISVGGIASLDNVTDSDGLAIISVPYSYAGELAVLTVEATTYKKYTQNINLNVGALPQVVQLDQQSN